MAEAKKRGAARPQKADPASPKEKGKGNSAPKNDQNQFWSIILFALGTLVALMTLIKGSAGWRGIHNVLLGMFGAAVFFVPVILIYTSIQIGMEKSQKNVAGRAVWGVAMTFLASAALQIFLIGEVPGDSFFKKLSGLYRDGMDLHGGGVASGIFAWPLIAAFGGLGAKIITVILFFVFALLLSGLGLIDFLKLLCRPFGFMKGFFNGIQDLLLGGYYDDEYEDDIDDDGEKKSFDKDLEAIELVNSRKPKKVEPVTQIEKASGVTSDGFLFDVPIPTNDVVIHNTEPPAQVSTATAVLPVAQALEAVKAAGQPDADLERLISKAAEKKEDAPDKDEIGSDDTQQEIVIEPLYILPPIELLKLPQNRSNSADAAIEMREKADTIVNTLRSFGVEVKIRDIFRGPSITRYEVQPGSGVKISRIKNLDADIALNLAEDGVRIAPVKGKPVVGIEVPNGHRDTVSLREILSSNEFRNAKSKLTFAVGKDIAGNCILGDISKMPHVIIAGTTGSGKSVCTRSIIMSILFNAKPDEVKLILIDPKMVEFKVFDGIPHLLTPIIIEAKKAPGALNWAVNEMMKRYRMLSDTGTNDLRSYNEYAEANELDKMPQIVIFIDELADMMLVAKNEVEDSIQRLAQMGRAAGMHLVVATQRPTTDVITGTIKANIPSRIALSVSTAIDSRTIIDDGGADKLLGNGDMLYKPIGVNDPLRVQGCFASNAEIQATIEYIKAQGEAEYDHSVTEAVESYVPQTKGGGSSDTGDSNISDEDEDILFRAMEVAVMNGQVSTTMLQKKLKLGYAKASRFIDELEERGVIGPSEGSKPRKVYMSRMQFDEMKLRRMQDID